MSLVSSTALSPEAYHDYLQALNHVVYDMERVGVPIDLEVCRDIEKRAEADELSSKAELDSMAGRLAGRTETNWGYFGFLVSLLHDPRPGGLGLEPSPFWKKGRCKPGEVKTDDRALEWLGWQNPEHRDLLALIRKWRRQRRIGTYARSFRELALPHPDGSMRLHPSYGMASDGDNRPGARTGRFGVKNPPLQQVPKSQVDDEYDIRSAFIALPNAVLMTADQTQLEIAVMGHMNHRLFGATGLRDAVHPDAPDMHSATAKYVFGEVLGHADIAAAHVGDIKGRFKWYRNAVKAIRYGLNYGKGAYGFGNTLFDEAGEAIGEETAQRMIDALLDMHPEIRAYQEWVYDYVAKHRGIHSLMGRWNPAPDGASDTEWKRKRAQRQCLNYPMQAGAQEIMMAAMVELHRRGFTQTLQVHDEIHVMVKEEHAEEMSKTMRDVMENSVQLHVQLTAIPSRGRNWLECK